MISKRFPELSGPMARTFGGSPSGSRSITTMALDIACSITESATPCFRAERWISTTNRITQHPSTQGRLDEYLTRQLSQLRRLSPVPGNTESCRHSGVIVRSKAGKRSGQLDPCAEPIAFDVAHDDPWRKSALPGCCPGRDEPLTDLWRANLAASAPKRGCELDCHRLECFDFKHDFVPIRFEASISISSYEFDPVASRLKRY